MKKRVSILILALAMGAALLPAQSPAAATGKIGVINIQEAIASTAEGKKALADIQKKYGPKQQELQRQQQEIQALQSQIQNQATTLSDEEQRRLNRELEEKQKVFKRSTDDANADFSADRDDAVRRIGQRMVRIINDYAQQNGFALVLDDAQIPVYYAAKEIDLTEEIVKRYDAAYAADAGATSGAAAAPASKPAAPATKPGDKPKP